MRKFTGRKAEGLHKEIQGSGVWAVSIAAAFLAATAVFLVMLKLEKDMLSEYEKGNIYTAVKQIPKGQVITQENYESFFEKKELDKGCIPQTAIDSPEQAQGLVAVYDIEEGVLLPEGMFEELDKIMDELENPVIAAFKAEDLYQVAGGVLRAGDRIHIYSVQDTGETFPVWKNIFVQQVFDTSGTQIPNGDFHTAASRINIYLDEKEVENFYGELSTGSLRVVKVCG